MKRKSVYYYHIGHGAVFMIYLGVSDSMEIKIKIRRIEHGYTRLSRRLYASRYSADFTTGSSISDIRNLLSYVYNGNVGGVDVERPDWSALFAAMFILEENEPAPPPKGRLADLDVVMLAEIQPGGYREEFIVRPWDLLPDIANAVSRVVDTSLDDSSDHGSCAAGRQIKFAGSCRRNGFEPGNGQNF